MATAAAPKLTFIPDVFEEHFEDAAFLWGQRANALRSPAYTMREFARLEERIDAHTQGMLVVGERMIPLVDEALGGRDRNAALAAAFALLRLDTDPAAASVLSAFEDAAGPALDGLRRALCLAPSARALPQVRALARTAPPPTAAAAAEVLAFQTGAAPPAAVLHKLLADEDAAVRQSAWRTVSYLAVPVEPTEYSAALRDDDLAVRRAAVTAAAWSGIPGVLVVLRRWAREPTPDQLDVLHTLAVIGGDEDLPTISAIGKAEELGPARFRLLGAFGHPAVVPMLLSAMASRDAETAAAAGAAFTRITGHDVSSGERTKVGADGENQDSFDAEFADEVTLPEVERARAHWAEVQPALAHASRICRGFDVTRGLGPDDFVRLDMESRSELLLRSRYYGAWHGTPMQLEVFPQRR
jgi:uncharacterized protein (TIGR02270 family)